MKQHDELERSGSCTAWRALLFRGSLLNSKIRLDFLAGVQCEKVAARVISIAGHGAGPACETENRTTLQKPSEFPAQEDSKDEQTG